MSKKRASDARDARTKLIDKILQKGRDDHVGHPAVLELIQALSTLDPISTSDFIIYISQYFDNVYELFHNTRKSLMKILGSVGFVFIPKPHAIYSLRGAARRLRSPGLRFKSGPNFFNRVEPQGGA